MASAFGHAATALAIGSVFPRRLVGPAALATGAALSVLPDADVLGWRLGIPYDSLLGHRGLTHSLAFAAAAAALGAAALTRAARSRAPRSEAPGDPVPRGAWWLFAFLFLAAASHGLLDAATDGGRGVAFFAPVDAARYFFPFRPIAVSPISPAGFFTARGLAILKSEALWIGIPAASLAALAFAVRRLTTRASSRHG